ncbi:MAG: ATP-binding protein [Leptospirales bacterium]|jgi:anti-sigma regulatory factor (Ser/Thr protein kinase)|nr:ATP-binding protein [Leptospirales bacterium]HNL01635.1 ATP-binding protein [Leptospiraceae bacterium]HNN59219.1 ATP-binding protein [Leptospiraceae bacterium]HQI17931.1 ATP-binding protein [Leptospiraceae bacterium]
MAGFAGCSGRGNALTGDTKDLEKEVKALRAEIAAFGESPYLKSSIKNLVYEAVIDRTEVERNELGKRINEKHGTMYEIKEQARRMAILLGLDADNIRLLVTEAVQNILEHGSGRWVQVRLDARNEGENPALVCAFKHEIPDSEKYTLQDAEANALKGDVTSEFFDFESPRGRGEFIMKQLTDERRIINGVEINRDGKKVHYFKRILINYRNPEGVRDQLSFQEIKDQIDRLGYQDVVCCFLIQHSFDKPDLFTVACSRDREKQVVQVMTHHSCSLVEQEAYFSNVFATFAPERPLTSAELQIVFDEVKSIVYGD